MKKFLNIRNVLIVLIILIAVIYIVFMRTKNPSSSKTSDLFYQLINKDKVAMSISFKGNDMQGEIIYSTDKSNNKTIELVEVYDYSEDLKEANITHIKNIIIRENGKTHTYQLNYDLKNYIDFGEKEDSSDITDWIENLNDIVSESKYYTRYYKIMNGKRLLVENFPEKNYTFYYDNNNLVYIKAKDSFSENENILCEIKIYNDLMDNSLFEIPSDFVLNDVSNADQK